MEIQPVKDDWKPEDVKIEADHLANNEIYYIKDRIKNYTTNLS